MVNATDGKIVRLLIEDEPFDIRYSELRGHERVLDFRAGVLRRLVEWVSPTGRSVRVSSTRLVSLTHRVEGNVRPVAALAHGGRQRRLCAVRPRSGLGPIRRREAEIRRCARVPRFESDRAAAGSPERSAARGNDRRARQPQERVGARADCEQGVQPHEGSVPYLRAALGVGLRAPSSPPAPTP